MGGGQEAGEDHHKDEQGERPGPRDAAGGKRFGLVMASFMPKMGAGQNRSMTGTQMFMMQDGKRPPRRDTPKTRIR